MYLSYKNFLFFVAGSLRRPAKLFCDVCESQVQLLARAKKHTLRSGSRYIYLTDRYICISLLGAAAAEDDSVKMLLGNIRISALQTVGSQPMAEKCE